MRRLRLILCVLSYLLLFSLTTRAYALDILRTTCNSSPTTQSSPTCQQNAKHANDTVNPAVTTIHDAVDIIGLVAGIAAVIIIIYSGIRYIINGSNPEGQKQARSSLIGALIGLVIIALAWTIVNLAINLLS